MINPEIKETDEVKVSILDIKNIMLAQFLGLQLGLDGRCLFVKGNANAEKVIRSFVPNFSWVRDLEFHKARYSIDNVGKEILKRFTEEQIFSIEIQLDDIGRYKLITDMYTNYPKFYLEGRYSMKKGEDLDKLSRKYFDVFVDFVQNIHTIDNPLELALTTQHIKL